MSDDPLFDTDNAGPYLCTPPATLQYWRHVGRGPRYLKIGRRIFYRQSALDDFLRAAEVEPEAA